MSLLPIRAGRVAPSPSGLAGAGGAIIPSAMATLAGGKILVVEDDDSMREALARLLGAAGFESASYASAEALLAGGAREDAACVVSDLKLPAMSGLDLLTELRARGGWPPFILVTAHDAPGLREEAARRGAAAYLVKPFLGRALLDAVRSAIGPTRTS